MNSFFNKLTKTQKEKLFTGIYGKCGKVYIDDSFESLPYGVQKRLEIIWSMFEKKSWLCKSSNGDKKMTIEKTFDADIETVLYGEDTADYEPDYTEDDDD